MSFVGNVLLRTTSGTALKRFAAACSTPAESQDRLLREILTTNADTEFGRRHDFGRISSFEEFRRRVLSPV